MREATAHHEAGHAAVSWLRDLGMAEVTIRADDVAYGRCVGEFPDWFEPDIGWDDDHQVHAENFIESTLAGAESERLYREKHPEENWAQSLEDGAERDQENAWAMAEFACNSPGEAEAFLAWLRIRARGLVSHNWRFVEALAKELLEKETLTGDEARRLLLVELHGAEKAAVLVRAVEDLTQRHYQ